MRNGLYWLTVQNPSRTIDSELFPISGQHLSWHPTKPNKDNTFELQ